MFENNSKKDIDTNNKKQKGDDLQKIHRIYEKYSKMMYNAAFKILKDKSLAEDAVHDSMICIYNNLHKIDEGNYFATAAFVSTISHNAALDIYNNKMNLKLEPESLEIIEDPKNYDPLIHVVELEDVEFVKQSILKLPVKYRDILIHKYYLDETYTEISKIFNISAETARKRLERAKILLKKTLEKRRTK